MIRSDLSKGLRYLVGGTSEIWVYEHYQTEDVLCKKTLCLCISFRLNGRLLDFTTLANEGEALHARK